jgi:uncharacterized protein YbjT (DUF2867 family)
MRVLVTGAYGLIGSACLARLRRDGHALVGAGRAVTQAQRRLAFAQWVEADFRRLVSIESWRPLLADIDVVVNCVGVLQDSARDDLHRVHVTATCALFDACERLGVRRVIHVSAIGVDEAGPTAFSRTKAEADRHLQNLDLDWMILRPALVLASAVYGGSALLRALSAFPGAIPLVDADARMQIVGIDDVAETVAFCAAAAAPSRLVWQLAHPQVHTLADIAIAYRRWLGFPPRPVIRLPRIAGQAVALLGDQLGRLGWRSPARSTTLRQLSAGVIGDPAPWISATGIEPASLADVLTRPATIQDRWSARLYLLKPVAIFGLAFHSVVSGLITARSFAGSMAWLRSLVAEVGFSAVVTMMLVATGAIVDFVLGLAVLVRATARPALIGMLLVTVGAMIFEMAMLARYGTDRWLQLLTTVSTAVPVMLAIAFALATLDDR